MTESILSKTSIATGIRCRARRAPSQLERPLGARAFALAPRRKSRRRNGRGVFCARRGGRPLASVWEGLGSFRILFGGGRATAAAAADASPAFPAAFTRWRHVPGAERPGEPSRSLRLRSGPRARAAGAVPRVPHGFRGRQQGSPPALPRKRRGYAWEVQSRPLVGVSRSGMPRARGSIHGAKSTWPSVAADAPEWPVVATKRPRALPSQDCRPLQEQVATESDRIGTGPKITEWGPNPIRPELRSHAVHPGH